MREKIVTKVVKNDCSNIISQKKCHPLPTYMCNSCQKNLSGSHIQDFMCLVRETSYFF